MTETHEDKETIETYELGYHLVPSLGEEDLALRVSELMQAITDGGGSIIAEGAPEPFTLAYMMKVLRGGTYDKYTTSFFGWIRFSAPRASIEALTAKLDANENLIRHLLFKLEAAAFAAVPVRAPHDAAPAKALVKKQQIEEKGEVSEEELDKQIEQLTT